MLYDVVVIGAGVIGTSVARYLSKYDLEIAVIEKEEDICSGTSKANSAIVHAGHDAANDSLKAKFNLQGSQMMEDLSKELDFSYKRNGSFVVCFSEEDKPALQELYERGVKNGVQGLKIISGEEARQKEPHLSKEVVAALDCPTGAIVCPFELTQAMAENAAENGVRYLFNTEVQTIATKDNIYVINDFIQTKAIVNCAGVYSDVIHNLVSDKKYHITAKKGDYVLLDKEVGNIVSKTIFQLPTKAGKGVLVTPTVHGNLLVGPSATIIDGKEFNATTAEDLNRIQTRAKCSVDNIPFNKIITSFSGLRAHEEGGDFILEESENNFFDCVGIESPGLSAAPAIGQYMADLVANKLNATKKEHFINTRKGIVRIAKLPFEERKKAIDQNPMYGHIICRCEEISEGEIVEAIHRVPGAVSLDGVKRRVRAGMGRCQAGFCTPKTMEILSRELRKPMSEICKNNPSSKLLDGKMRDR